MIQRRFVTLFELLIVMAILSLIAGFIAISINKALVDQRFRSEVSLIIDELRLAQNLMLILGTDVRVHFAKEDDKGIRFWIELETTLPDGIHQAVIRKFPLLKTIRSVLFVDPTNTSGMTTLNFLSKGAVMSKGVVTLTTAGENQSQARALQSYIGLAGYPKPIEISDTLEAAQALVGAVVDRNFDDALTQDTIHKLPEKLKQVEDESKEKKERSRDSSKAKASKTNK